MKRLLSIIIIILSISLSALAQNSWGLKECLSFALHNSPHSKLNKLDMDFIRNENSSLIDELLPTSAFKLEAQHNIKTPQSLGQIALATRLPLINPSSQFFIREERAINAKQILEQGRHIQHQITNNIIDLYTDYCIWGEVVDGTKNRMNALSIEIQSLSRNIEAGKGHEYQKKEYENILIQEQILLAKQQEELTKREVELLYYLSLPHNSEVSIIRFSIAKVHFTLRSQRIIEAPTLAPLPNTILIGLSHKKSIINRKKYKTLLYPKISFFANLATTWDLKHSSTSQLEKSLSPIFGIDIEFNLSYFWKQRSSLRKAKIEEQRAKTQYDIQLSLEKKQDWLIYTELLAKKKQFELSEQKFKNSADIEKYKKLLFENGRIGFYELEASLLKVRDSEIEYVQSGYSYMNTLLKWYYRRGDIIFEDMVTSLY